ncbi:hypothetical protein [Thiorhodospira sibirica]|uniref:hypothetical protein n=1 Tax=Thiorhodospira sibirica TaxID=154347 RepID=UPI00022C22C7|nr:hypothetical protein [Thiorhodospira sibirica]
MSKEVIVLLIGVAACIGVFYYYKPKPRPRKTATDQHSTPATEASTAQHNPALMNQPSGESTATPSPDAPAAAANTPAPSTNEDQPASQRSDT